MAALSVAASSLAWAVYSPEVGLAKQASVTRLNADGTYSVDFSLRMQNLGTEPLVKVQIVERLAEEIAPATIVSITRPTARGALRFINPDFDGTTRTYLLTGEDRLGIHEEGYVEFTLTFDANGHPGPFFNRAGAWTQGEKSGVGRDDESQNGTDPDPDTPSERPVDNINPQDNSDPTPINLPPDVNQPNQAKIGLAKAAEPSRTIVRGEYDPVTDPNNSTRTIDPVEVFPFVSRITLTLENLGPVPLTQLVLVDDLRQTFPSSVSYTILGSPVGSGGLLVNPEYDGSSDTSLLASGNALAVGASATVTFSVAFDPADLPGPFANFGNVTALPDPPPGSSAPTSPVGDTSDNGTDPDPDGDGEPNEPGENDPTPIDVPQTPETDPEPGPDPMIGLAKAASDIEPLGPGEFAATIDLRVVNLGDESLSQVQVTDNLRPTFADAERFRILSTPTATGGLPINLGYDGWLEPELLGPDAVLEPGESQVITYRVGITPGAAAGPFLNEAFASGLSPSGDSAEDQSTDGTEPDPNGNGSAGDPGEAEPTPIPVPAVVRVGLAKAATIEPLTEQVGDEAVADNELRVTFVLTVENFGNTPLLELQVVDSLATTFRDATQWRLLNAPSASGGLQVNPNFDGDGDERLLLPDVNRLEVGQRATITVDVGLVPARADQQFFNSATVTGVGPDGTPGEDDSTNGLDPDPNGDGNPDEAEPTPVDPPSVPVEPAGPGAVAGTVFFDTNHDDTLGGGEQRLAGWRVVIYDAEGRVVAETLTNAQGDYRFDDLAPGEYSVEFMHPDTGITWAVNTVEVVSDATARQDLPVDPQGRIYDSVSRVLVPGATVRILNAITGSTLPADCLLPNQQDQTVGADAAYRFDIIAGADGQCPGGLTEYRLAVTAVPSPHLLPPSERIPPATTLLDATRCEVDPDPSEPCVVQPNPQPPTDGQATGYFLQIAIAAGDPDVVNNHIPLDRPDTATAGDLISVQKTSLTRRAAVGDLVFFELTVQNLSANPQSNISLQDDLPGGFALEPDSVQLIEFGPDGQLDTADDVISVPGISGTDPVTFGPLELEPNQRVVLRYGVRVSAGLTQGSFVNRVTPLQAGTVVGADAQAAVDIVADPLFDNTTIIGKVFDDRDGDGWQDPAMATELILRGGPLREPMSLPDLRARRAETQMPSRQQMQLAADRPWTEPLELVSAEGTTLRLSEQGELETLTSGAVAKGLSGQQLSMRTEQQNGKRRLVIENLGIVERGLPGIRLATVGGLIVEADSQGRYHLADVETGRTGRGANFILKLDTSSLPDGARLISENPRVLRLTQALMSRIDFAVQMPPAAYLPAIKEPGQVLEIITRRERVELPPVRFDTGRADIPDNYAQSIGSLLNQYEDRRDLRLIFVGHADPRPLRGRLAKIYGDNQGLAEARALEVANFAKRVLPAATDHIRHEGRGVLEPVASNTGPRGWAANRRVEIEVSWLEVQERQFEVAEAALAPTMGNTKTTRQQTQNIASFNYGTGESALNAALIAKVQRLVKQAAQRGEKVVRLEVTGHTDNQPLGAKRQARYGDNQGLSLSRAKNAAALLQQQLPLPSETIVAEGRGASEPIADNRLAAGRAQNRRVDLTLVTEVADTLERRWLTPLQQSATKYLSQGGAVWATEQPLVVTPKMDVLASQDQWQVGALEPTFQVYANYATFVDRFELLLFAANDLDRVRPLVSQRVDPSQGQISLATADWSELRAMGDLQYVLRAYGKGAQAQTWDETAPRILRVSQAMAGRAEDAGARRGQGARSDRAWGQNNLAVQRIATQGSLVRVQGIDADPAAELRIEGETVPIHRDGSFVWEGQRPVGTHRLAIVLRDEDGQVHQRDLNVEVDGDYQFAVALANLTVGQNQLTGSLEPLTADDHFDESVFVDGRIALYAKAKIRGRYLLTAQVDTTEDELSRMGKNLKREDPNRLFRQLDPDRYYPVYGDASSVVSDVDSQGAFYLRLEFDRTQLLWGNYNTGLTDTEFAQYNRTLYGAKLKHESTSVTEFGDAARELTLFASEAQSAAAHVSFAATGGSLYYLKHTDIVQGSEKVWVETRRRDSNRVLDRQVMIEGRDYEVDALQGRILLRRPLSQVVADRSPGIIRSSPLEGDNVVLLVDYEYLPERFAADDVTAGVRGKLWAGDHLGVGVSKVIDERDGTDYDLEAVDVTLRAGKGTYVRAEYARSDAQQNLANYSSIDGGLSFTDGGTTLPGADIDGEAVAVEARVNFAEVSEQQGDLHLWWKDRDQDFSAGRQATHDAAKDMGADLYWRANEQLSVSAGYSELDREELGRDRVGRVQVDASAGAWSGGIEARYEDVQGIASGATTLTPGLSIRPLSNPPLMHNRSILSGESGDGEALLLGARVGYQWRDDTQLYVSGQSVASDRGNYEDNSLFSVGMNTALSERTRVGLEVSDGDRGSALMGAVEVAATDGLNLSMAGGIGSGAISSFSSSYSYGEGHELYGSYAVDPDRTEGPRDLLTLGQRRQLGNSTRIFSETQFGKDDRYASTSHLFGMDFGGLQDWLFTATVQRSDNERLGLDFERLATSIGARLERDDYRLSSRVEYRTDKGAGVDSRQILSSNSFTWATSPARRWLALLNWSVTDDELTDSRSARFIEFDLGHAYRPTWNNRWNMLAKYSYLLDLPGVAQRAGRADQRAHIFAIEALYDFTPRIELGGKIALKKGYERLLRDSGPWLDFGVRMAAVRARYHMLRRWDALVEYRWVADWLQDSQQQGAVLGVYRHLGEHLKIGVGYNFSGFDDDLKREDYDSHGWFLDLIGKF